MYCHLQIIDDSLGDICNACYHISHSLKNPLNNAFYFFSITAIIINSYPQCRGNVLNLHITVIVLC